jgi:hypothetical protein
MLLSQKETDHWIEIYKTEMSIPEEIKTFIYFQRNGENLDFSSVIEWLKPQKYQKHEIERLWIICDVVYSYHIILTCINPPRPPIAHIVISGYEGYANYGKWDIRGVYQMAEELIIQKSSLPNPSLSR